MSTTTIPAGPSDWTLDRRLRYRQVLEQLRRFARPGPVLELGAGAGGLSALGHDGPVVSVDLVRSPGLSVQADGCVLPFADGAFTTTVCVDVLEHLPAAARPGLLAEVQRVTTDLLLLGCPVGEAARAVDEDLLAWHRRTGRPAPEWLEEHVATGRYPSEGELTSLPGTRVLVSDHGVATWAHRAMTRANGRRGGTALQRLVPDHLLGTVAGATRRGSTYRSLVAVDLAPVAVSVIVATMDRADSLGGAVASILAQSDPDLEVLILDDASQDETPGVCDALAAADPRVRVVRRERPSGSCGMARNAALPHLRGRLVAICDDDVRWRPDHLARARRALEAAGAEACTTRAQRFLPDGRPYDTVGTDWGDGIPAVGDVDANCLVVARSVVRRFPDGRGRYGSEDYRLVLDLVERGVRFTHVAAETVDYTFNLASHCYRYDIDESGDEVRVSGTPVVRDVRGVVGRVTEAVEVRAARWRRRLAARR